jgi:spore germination protein GerM
MSKKPVWVILVVSFVLISGVLFGYAVSSSRVLNLSSRNFSSINVDEVVDFESCVRVVGQVQESTPRRCIWLNEVFVEDLDTNLQPLGNSSTTRTMQIDLYFTTESLLASDCGATTKITRTLPYSSSVANVSLQELFKGPLSTEDPNLMGSFTGMQEGFESLILDGDGTLTIDFNDLVLDQSKPYYLGNYGSSCGSGAWQQIYQTMRQFPGVRYVVFSVEGGENKWNEMVSMRGCPVEQGENESDEQFIQATKQCGQN